MPRPRENNLGYDYLPKLDKSYDMLQVFELMHQGKMNGYIAQGFNPLAAAPNKAKIGASLAKLKFLVIMDPLATETSEFWRTTASTTTSIQRRSRRRCFACRRPVSPKKTARWSIPRAGCSGTGRARTARAKRGAIWRSCRGFSLRMRKAYTEGRRRVSRSDSQLDLAICATRKPDAGRTRQGVQRQRARRSGRSNDQPRSLRKAGEQLAGFARTARRRQHRKRLLDLLRSLDPGGQPDGAARQLGSDRHRPDAQLGVGVARQPPYPVQPRVAAISAASRSIPTRKLIGWNGSAWGGADVPDFKVDENSGRAAWVRSS